MLKIPIINSRAIPTIFGFKTLERAYLLKVNGKVVERPQHMWMRVAVCIHNGNLEKIKQTYDLMSTK